MHIRLIECPRDAMQGIRHPISTEQKIRFLNLLLEMGFDTLDFGSFVSPKAIPQMADTPEIVPYLQKNNTRLLAIVANYKGAAQAASFAGIDDIGFPFSLSESFQLRNTHATLAEAFERVAEIQDLCEERGKVLVLYLSMGFGNPYGDPWSTELVENWIERFVPLGIKRVQLSDTIGVATPGMIRAVFEATTSRFPELDIGVHLHTHPNAWLPKMEAALQAGCRRFDGALLGFGGCPMARDELVGNMPMEHMIAYVGQLPGNKPWPNEKLERALGMAREIYKTPRS